MPVKDTTHARLEHVVETTRLNHGRNTLLRAVLDASGELHALVYHSDPRAAREVALRLAALAVRLYEESAVEFDPRADQTAEVGA